ncbi:MAG: carboxypeptidase regulatory-like domain-containing protein, partial [Bryobacteraceae bacterium]
MNIEDTNPGNDLRRFKLKVSSVTNLLKRLGGPMLMQRTRIVSLSVCALFCSVFLVGLARSQNVSATITGTIRDSSGDAIPDAKITIVNQGTGVHTDIQSNQDGSFSEPGLQTGTYTVTISKPGFESYLEKGIFIGPTVVRSVNATLNVGQVSTQVTVEATASQVQTTTSQISNSVAQQQVETLPLNGRNYQSLSALMPGVVNLNVGSAQGEGGFGTGNSISINGMGTSGTLYELDGVWNMNTGNMTQTTILPNPDSIQEFRTLQNNYSPKYSLLGSSIVLVQTRSGTREFHGTLWEYLRNDAFDARNFFSPSVLAEKQNIFGGTIGGPLFIPHVFNKDRNSTFFFISEQGVIRHIGSAQLGATPTADMRNGIFS